MYNPEEYTHEFSISIKGLTDEQVYQLNKELKSTTKLLFVLFLALAIVFMLIIYKVINLISPLESMFLPSEQLGDNDWRWFIIFLPLFIAGFISWKIYKQIGRTYISSKVKNLRLENLENKVKSLDKQVNPPRIEKPVAPEVQKEVNKIRALGKQNENQ